MYKCQNGYEYMYYDVTITGNCLTCPHNMNCIGSRVKG